MIIELGRPTIPVGLFMGERWLRHSQTTRRLPPSPEHQLHGLPAGSAWSRPDQCDPTTALTRYPLEARGRKGGPELVKIIIGRVQASAPPPFYRGTWTNIAGRVHRTTGSLRMLIASKTSLCRSTMMRDTERSTEPNPSHSLRLRWFCVLDGK